MKTISFVKKHLILGTTLMVGVVAMSFKMSGEKMPEEKASSENSVHTIYEYSSTDISEGAFANPGNWTVVNPEDAPDCPASGPRPCEMFVSQNETLSGKLAGKTNVQVLAIAESRKP